MANPLPPPVPPEANRPETDPVTQTLALIQPWIDYVPQQQRRLGLFICLALAIHLAIYPFLQVYTTRAELRHEPRPHVTVEDAQTTSLTGQPVDNFWDRLADPRLYLLPQQPMASLTSDEPAHDFDAINSNIGSKELPTAATPAGFQFVHPVNPPLDQRVGEALRPPRQSFSYQEPAVSISPKTTWQFDAALAARQPVSVPDLLSPISDTELGPTQLRVAVNSNGTVVHAMVEGSPLRAQNAGSGRLDLDQLAIQAARKIRFRFTDQPGLTWSGITVFWHYSAKPREEVIPTPPTGT